MKINRNVDLTPNLACVAGETGRRPAYLRSGKLEITPRRVWCRTFLDVRVLSYP